MWVHLDCHCKDWHEHFPIGVTYWCILDYRCIFCGDVLEKSCY